MDCIPPVVEPVAAATDVKVWEQPLGCAAGSEVSSKSLWSAGSSHIKCIIFNFIFHPISRFGYFSWDPFRCSLKWCLYIRIGCWIENPFLLWYNASEEITTNNKQLSSFKICIPDVDDTHFLGNVKSLFTYPFSTFKLLSGRTDISCPLKSTEKMESPCMNPALSHFGAGPILYLMIFTFPSLSIYCFEESCVQTPDGILLNERWVCYRSHLYRF